MGGVYRPQHPERTVLYRVLFHHFERFVAEYETRFEREYGYFRPIVKEVVEKYPDCGNPRCGFARIRCPNCEQWGGPRDVRLFGHRCRLPSRLSALSSCHRQALSLDICFLRVARWDYRCERPSAASSAENEIHLEIVMRARNSRMRRRGKNIGGRKRKIR